jgi:hypothetical protein
VFPDRMINFGCSDQDIDFLVDLLLSLPCLLHEETT